MTPTQQRLAEIYHYDPLTGHFTFKARAERSGNLRGDRAWNAQHAGRRAGYLRKNGKCLEIWVDGSLQKAHRCAWLYVHGYWPRDQIDHINRCPPDNRIANLRECDNSQNAANRGVQARSKSGVKGIFVDKNGTYRPYTKRLGKMIHLGSYATIEAAVTAREKAVRGLFGEFGTAA